MTDRQKLPPTSEPLVVTNADYEFKTPERNPLPEERNVGKPSTSFTSPKGIRPFPKAKPRLDNKRNTRKRQRTIYTHISGQGKMTI
ncbi:hypothetical protein FQR65_LT10974 [Abscondita terminalis]|nr:hypothetical protein FQR65_LT10974 [Abscondita terminalis]